MPNKPLLICGSGRTLWDDIVKIAHMGVLARELQTKFDVMAINEAFIALSHVDYLATHHDEKVWPWQMLRGPLIFTDGQYKTLWTGKTFSQRANKGVDEVLIFDGVTAGSSALYACYVGKHLGYSHMILCGVPYDSAGRFYEAPWTFGHEYGSTDGWKPWENAHACGDLEGVRSMSGHTKNLLGYPEREWLWQSFNAITA